MEYFYIGMITLFLVGIVVVAKTMDEEDMKS
jgi:hypothetical protein